MRINNWLCAVVLAGTSLWLAGCGGGVTAPTATLDELVKGEDGLRVSSTGELFTGWLVEYYQGAETNQLKSRSVIRDGKLNGLSEGWYTEGQQQVMEQFVDGKSHGVRVKWHPNGRKQAEDSIEHGELNGVCRKWHDNGQLAEEMTMVNGQADGFARSWHADGSQKAEVEMEMGKVVQQQFWEKGQKQRVSEGIAQRENAVAK